MAILAHITVFAILASMVLCQLETIDFCDSATEICYSSYTTDVGISYRIALPETSTTSDVILQIVSPIQYGWAALAWGGHMQHNPLTVAWPNGNNVVVSSRIATNYWLTPNVYHAAEYTYLQGTGVNNTHWTLNVRCRGCTRWESFDGQVVIDTQDVATFSHAYSSVLPWDPASNTSSFDIHDGFGHWAHDLLLARDCLFEDWVEENELPSVS